jgi:predicted dinucleotide-binding enzyme
MKIAIIGSGNIGGTLARAWANKGHEIIIGSRKPASEEIKVLLSASPLISVNAVAEAVKSAEVILIAAVPQATQEIAQQLGDVKDKIIIDAMNSVRIKPDPYPNTTEALVAWTNCENIVKCFNSTGYENLADPIYAGQAVDMFMAGNSAKGKAITKQLALDLGFAECYDMGGNDKFQLLESLAMVWINQAIMQKERRGMAIKILKR